LNLILQDPDHGRRPADSDSSVSADLVLVALSAPVSRDTGGAAAGGVQLGKEYFSSLFCSLFFLF
jgi:hypothetical protein